MTKSILVYLVGLSPTTSGAFSFWYTQVKQSSIYFRGDQTRRGREQVSKPIAHFVFTEFYEVVAEFYEVVAVLPLGCRNCCH